MFATNLQSTIHYSLFMAQQIGKRNVLLIGGAGFIGSHLCDTLVKEANVICIDNFITSSVVNIEHLLSLPNFSLINGDINNITDLDEQPEAQKFDVKYKGIQEIYNLAIPMSPMNFNKYKLETVTTNSQGTINALNLAVKYRAKFLQFSSSVVYGTNGVRGQYLVENEYFNLDPFAKNAVYDEGKKFAETLTATYREKFQLDAKIVRIFRTYGPRMTLFDGQMIADFIVAAIDNQPLVLYGGPDFTTSLIYVSDVVTACLKIMSSTEFGPLNIGSPLSHNLSEVAKKIIQKTGSSSQIQFAPQLQFMRELGLPNITAAKEKIDWFPVVTLDNGLDKTIEYTQAHKILVNWEKVQVIKE